MAPKKKEEILYQMQFNPHIYQIEEYQPQTGKEPYWKDVDSEREIFRHTFNIHRPFALKGPTGCGKTTLVRRMHWELGQEMAKKSYTPQYSFDPETGLYLPLPKDKQKAQAPSFPLYILEGTEDTDALHFLGGKNIQGKYVGGLLYHWAHTGGILLINEFAEMRGDVQTVFNGPMDKDRALTFPEIERIVQFPDHGMIVIAYNPGLQSKQTDLKLSVKQRLPAKTFGYPKDIDTEAEIIQNASQLGEKQVTPDIAKKIAQILAGIRNTDQEKERTEGSILANRKGVSTRLGVMAAEYIIDGTTPVDACITAIAEPLYSTKSEKEALEKIIRLAWG